LPPGSEIGSGSGIAVILSAGTGIAAAPSDHAFTMGFAACAGVAAIAVLATLVLPRTPQRPASPIGAVT
jgi:hypothetical protein